MIKGAALSSVHVYTNYVEAIEEHPLITGLLGLLCRLSKTAESGKPYCKIMLEEVPMIIVFQMKIFIHN